VRSCGVLGHWQGSNPICRLIRCGYPGHLLNGHVIGRSYLFGDVIHYSCHEGYKLQGSKSRQCNEHGFWTGVRPACKEIQCPFDETQFANGHVDTLPLPEQKIGSISLYKVSSQIKLVCDHPDAEMDGQAQLTCTNGGHWNHDLPICHQLPCTKLPIIANGKIASTEHQPPFYSGAELEFKCNLGFRLMQSRKKVHSRLICHDSGHWQPPRNYRNPKCIRKQCARPRTIPYGRIISQPMASDYNSTLEVVCIPGYILPNGRRNQLLRCDSNTQWRNADNPLRNNNILRCRPVQCEFPEDTRHGMVEFSGLYVGSMARYSCERSFTLRGRAQRRCLYTGIWSHRPPKCTRN